ncbi:hypothetical protein Cfla_2553 [Cellulomonas flavigena DSM 20109]|uniref:Uncharacterized protein n=1 Tax=Cellulomonas flavigena (strain ATCC 482 / DSM 20109 / BCRC 11376 / JCM 18109 / NBRC 3775 / NCIMB 8073 / NRS 134) TaxID=446466 RepID=D5UI96_CELFN|nr:hypothetical protein [Cellulomonas flavigena]ADG75441.1 hypothetical protein Cfla_2553 [Cellulomonas flavigena DSM 20109]
MSRVAFVPAVAGAGVAAVGYLLVTAVALPAVASGLLQVPIVVAEIAVLVATCAPLLLGGAVSAATLRRRRATSGRSDALVTALAGGVAAAVVVSMLGAAASAATGRAPALVPVVVTLLVSCTAAALGALLVPHRGDAHVLAVRNRSRGDAGQGSLEALGVTAVAGILVLALVVALGPGGRLLGDELRVHLCRLVTLGQGACGSTSGPTAEKSEPTRACTLEDLRDNRTTAVSVTYAQSETGDLIRIERLPGDQYRVSRQGTAMYGLQDGFGGGVSWTVDGKTYGLEAQAAGAGTAGAGFGATWVVDGAEKDALVDHLKSERDWNTLASSLESVGASRGVSLRPLVEAGHALYNWATDAYQPPPPDETFTHVGVHASGSASAAAVAASASGKVDRTNFVGVREDVATGRTTLYYTASVDGSLGGQVVAPTNEASASSKGELIIGVSYDSEGNMLDIHAQGVSTWQNGTKVTSLFAEPGTPPRVDGDSDGVLYEARLSITDAESARIATGFLVASGVVSKDPRVQWHGAELAARTFMDAARQRGEFTRQRAQLDGSTSSAGQIGLQVAGIGLGGAFENSTTTISTSDPEYWNGRSWAPWTGCAA